MLKQNKWTLVVTSLTLLLPVAVGLLLWDKLPDRIAIHWGLDGQPDGWSGKTVAVFGIPLLLLAFHWLCVLLTGLDRRSRGQHPKVFRLVLWLIPLMSLAVNGFVYMYALGTELNIKMIMCLLVGVMFLFIGNYMPKCRQNRFIGIRIKWTLESEENWNATHRLAGKLWMLGGLLMMVIGFLPPVVSISFMMAVILLMVLVPIVYSGWYRKHKEN